MQFIIRVSMIGMALAVAVLVLVLSVMNGFDREFRERVLALVPHVTFNLAEPLDEWSAAQQIFDNAASVKRTSPFVSVQALAMRGSKAEPVSLHGLDQASLQSHFGTFNREQKPENSWQLDKNEVLIGKRLAKKLGLDPGHSFRVLFVADGHTFQSQTSRATKSITLKIRGLLNTGTELDTLLVVSRLQDLASVKHGRIAIDGFQFQVMDIFKARAAVYPAIDQSGLSGYLNDWRYQYGNLYTAIQMSRQLVVILLATIVAIAAFNIFVSLGMSVRHRRNEIAVLRGYGLQKIDVLLSFCLQGIYMFIPGFIYGAIAGIALALAAPALVDLLELAIGVQFLDPSVYPIDYLPSEVRAPDILLIFVLSLAASILATLIPAWRASRLNPASVLS